VIVFLVAREIERFAIFIRLYDFIILLLLALLIRLYIFVILFLLALQLECYYGIEPFIRFYGSVAHCS
jgi:hypothetical protein